MKQNYFVVDGIKYYTGAIFITQDMVGKRVEASFVYYDTDKDRYVYKVKDCICDIDHNNFWRMFICMTDKVNKSVRMPTIKTKKDIEINGLFIGWVWYIFLMLISAIFKDAIGLWILISVIFFGWRAKKIKEEGLYIEW